MTSSPSQFSFQCEQHSPLSKNIETEDAMNKVFEMYFNNKESPNFTTLIQQEDQNQNDDSIKNILGDITHKSNTKEDKKKSKSQPIPEDPEKQTQVIYEKGMGKMQELGETIKKSMSQIHQKCNETKITLNKMTESIQKQQLEKQQENKENKSQLDIDFNDLWDQQLNKCFHDFMHTAQDALLKATTPQKIQPLNQVKGSALQPPSQIKSSSTIQPRKKALSTQKFSNSSIQLGQKDNKTNIPNNINSDVSVRRKPGSAMRFSTSNIQVKKPGSTSKFFPQQKGVKVGFGSGAAKSNVGGSTIQGKSSVAKGSVQKIGILNKSKDIVKRSVGRVGNVVNKKPVFK